MTLVKFRKHRLPWYDNMFADLLGTDRMLMNDMLMEDNWMPAMNIKENDENYQIDVAAPGFSKKDFDINIENGALHISAEKEEKIEEKEDNYTRKEFSYNSFSRSFTLPDNVNEDDKVVAKYKDGILKLELRKLHEDQISHKKIIKIS